MSEYCMNMHIQKCWKGFGLVHFPKSVQVTKYSNLIFPHLLFREKTFQHPLVEKFLTNSQNHYSDIWSLKYWVLGSGFSWEIPENISWSKNKKAEIINAIRLATIWKKTFIDVNRNFHWCLFSIFCSEGILVFLTGQEEIEATVKQIWDISKELVGEAPPLCVFPLYASQPPVVQLRVFSPVPKVSIQ